MGEYANRKKDGKRIKIGTCESLYYLRYDQRNEVAYDFGEYEYLWRIPTPTEDSILAGEFEFGGLLTDHKYIPYELKLKYNLPESVVEFLSKNKGLKQVSDHRDGMLINLDCYHGLKLPQDTDEAKFHWNGKSDCIYLAFLANKERELLIGTTCKLCNKLVLWEFDEIEPLMESLWMKLRLLHQCTDYWYEHNSQPCHYSVTETRGMKEPLEIYNITGEKDKWHVALGDKIIHTGTWEECRDNYIENLNVPDLKDPRFDNHFNHYYEVNAMKARYLQSKEPKEYYNIKQDGTYQDAVLLFRKGEFYEAYNEDADTCEEVLDITATKRRDLRVVGFQCHALDSYLPRLVRAGKRVAIID